MGANRGGREALNSAWAHGTVSGHEFCLIVGRWVCQTPPPFCCWNRNTANSAMIAARFSITIIIIITEWDDCETSTILYRKWRKMKWGEGRKEKWSSFAYFDLQQLDYNLYQFDFVPFLYIFCTKTLIILHKDKETSSYFCEIIIIWIILTQINWIAP